MGSLQILCILSGSWFFLVTFLVLGMCQQKYMRRASSRFSNGSGGLGAQPRDLTPTSSTASIAAAAAAASKSRAPRKA
ncbi:hypothetical protein PAAG_12045 [Paracoccidioides lutzii Pb01]|uniref:Uncharacterized protein n=1 Tax=Paracoccidioides lutzii (strain ATCC MYA-826 / Pb01) TaxID=502779 RepID=A0A0A2VK60_PARBA|nr:hypothetical protein PAAG_12045 [Paracoccidioides lutzii Pb01]KGQ01274.1 hypothetical protein PAAG_12045 [Paracoccidioides lutzii Pb01]